jgi:hypothetical protein
MKIGIADFECKGVKISKQGVELLFTDAEFFPDFPYNLCSNHLIKTLEPLALLKRVTCLTTFVFKVWSTSV